MYKNSSPFYKDLNILYGTTHKFPTFIVLSGYLFRYSGSEFFLPKLRNRPQPPLVSTSCLHWLKVLIQVRKTKKDEGYRGRPFYGGRITFIDSQISVNLKIGSGRGRNDQHTGPWITNWLDPKSEKWAPSTTFLTSTTSSSCFVCRHGYWPPITDTPIIQ